MSETGRRPGATVLLFGLFVALQTFVLLSRGDRWEVLFWVTRETWLLVALLWAKNLFLAALAGAAFVLLLRRARELPGAAAPEPAPSLVALGAAAVVLGIALRWVFPETIPPGLWFDPPFEARALLEHPGEIPWIGGVPLHDDPAAAGNRELVSYVYLHFYDAMFRLFGRAETGFLALSAVPGCLLLLAAFWLAAEVFGPSAALLGVALVSLARWPLVFSRWSYTASAAMPLALLAGAAALAALRTRRVSLAVLSGVATGLSLHTHSSAWGIAAGLGVFSLAALRDRPARRLVAASWTAAALAFAPFAWGYLTHPENLGGRLRDVPVGTRPAGAWGPRLTGPLAVPATLAYNAVEYTGVLLFTVDPNPRDGLPGRAAVTPLLGVAALLGLGASAARGTRGDAALFALLLGSLAGGIFSNPGGAPNTIRICLVVVLALLAAAWLLLAGLARLEERGGPRAALGAGGVLALLLVLETAPFLGRWADDPLVRRNFCESETRAARLVRTLAGEDVLLEKGAFRHPFVFDALSGPTDPRRPIRRAPERTVSALAAAPPAGPVWLVVREAALPVLRAAGWRCARGVSPGGLTADVVVAFARPPRPG
jgi:hypothetical protein